MSGDLYQKWRESEAYAVPMTEDGVKLSQHRWRGFNMGYKQAMKDVINLLMVQHKAAKDSHNYWQVAANLIKAEHVHAVNTSQERVSKMEKSEHEAPAPPHQWSNVTDEALMEEVRRRGFVIRDAQVGHKWVGLTDEELFGLTDEMYSFARHIEAKLKEKNHG